jgi:hypothetical protein
MEKSGAVYLEPKLYFGQVVPTKKMVQTAQEIGVAIAAHQPLGIHKIAKI